MVDSSLRDVQQHRHTHPVIQRYIPIGVVAPMRIEFRQIAHLRSERLLIRHSGVGPDRASAAAIALIHEGCRLIISWGFCGALGNLEVGDIVRAGTVIDAATNQRLSSSLPLPDTVISTDQVAHRRRKVDLANSGAVAVDMESAAIARVCIAEKLAFAVLRVVVDDRQASWPSRFEDFSVAGPWGRLALAIQHPQELFVALSCIHRGKAGLKRLSSELEGFSRRVLFGNSECNRKLSP